MSTEPSYLPHTLEVEEPKPWYKRPLVLGTALVGTMFGVSLWSYVANPDWLGESDSTNALIERILQGNPNLSREDLEQDVQTDNLSFWFGRSDQEYTGVAVTRNGQEEGSGEGSLLEQFMNQQKNENQADGDRPTPTTAPQTPPETTPNATATNNQGRSALDVALYGDNKNSGEGLSALQLALQQYQTNQTNTTATTTNNSNTTNLPTATTSPTSPNTTPSIYENNTGIPTQSPVPAATSGTTRTSRNGVPTTATPTVPTFTPRSRRQQESAIPTFDPNAYGNPNAGNNTAIPQAQQGVNNNQRRQTNFNTNGGGYQRIGNGEINSFADPLGRN